MSASFHFVDGGLNGEAAVHKVGWLVRYRPKDLEFWLAALPAGGSDNSTRNRRVAATA